MSRFNRPFLWLLALAVIGGGAAAGYSLYKRTQPAPPVVYGDEPRCALGLEQRSPEGRLVLDEIWRTQVGLDTLRISGHFTEGNPNEHYHIRSRIRDTPEGFENGGYSWLLGTETQPTSGETAFLFAYARFPIASDKLYVRVYFNEITTGALEAVSDFEFANPFPGRKKTSDWTPVSLPATQIADPLEVTLTKLESGFALPESSLGFRESYSRTYITLKEQGGLSTAWSVWGIQFSTDSGVSFRSSQAGDRSYGEARVTTGGTFWKDDGPWKLQVTLMRSNGVRPDEIIELPEMGVPAHREAISSQEKWTVANTEVQFLGISGGGAKSKAWESEEPGPNISLYFKFPEQARGFYLKLLSVTDETGAEIDAPIGAFATGGEDGRAFCFSLPRQAKRPKKLRCRVGVIHEKRQVEFVALPSFLADKYQPEMGSQ